MDSIVLTKFYESLKEKDNLNTAISIRNMLNEIPVLMADRLVARFKVTLPEYEIWKYKPNFCGIYFQINDEHFKVDIWTRETGYDIYVFNDKEREKIVPFAKVKALEKFQQTDNSLVYCDFRINDEQLVIEWAEELMKEIKELGL